MSGTKMSSRNKEALNAKGVIEYLESLFEQRLAYNILAGYILKSRMASDKNIDSDSLSNHKLSPGLYISYTMARLKSAGLVSTPTITIDVEFQLLRARVNLDPTLLFNFLVEYCKTTNTLYSTHRIVGNEANSIMFTERLSNIVSMSKSLGLFEIDNV
jgi:arginyl-tRNA synthetase